MAYIKINNLKELIINVVKLSCLTILFCVSGCSVKSNSYIADFEKYYKQLSEVSKQSSISEPLLESVTLAVDDMELVSFLRLLADKAGISIICASNLDDKKVTIDVKNQPVNTLLDMLARRLEVSLTRSGNLYYLGEIKAEDRGVYVRKVYRVDKDSLQNTIELLRSEYGRGLVYADGLVVVGDRVQLLRKLDEMFDRIESAPINSWCVQFYVMSISDSLYDEFGVDSNIDFDLSYKLVNGSASDATTGILSAFIKADKTDQRIETITEPMFVLQDGETSEYHSGQTIKVPLKTVSDAGTVQTTDYQDVDSGLQISCHIIDCGNSQAKLTLELTYSSIIGYTESAPNLSTDEFRTSAIVDSGEIYLLGSFQQKSLDTQISGFFQTFKTDSNSDRKFMIWSKLFKIEN